MKIALFAMMAIFSGAASAADPWRIQADVEGRASLNPNGGPVFVQFVGSDLLTNGVRQDLMRSGYAIAMRKDDAKQVVVMKGVTHVRAPTGKAVSDDLASIAEGARAAPNVPTGQGAPVGKLPDSLEHSTEKPIFPEGTISVVSGNPVGGDFGDQSRSYAQKLMSQGIGANVGACPKEGCKTKQTITQSVVISVEVEKGGKPEKAKVTASMQSESVLVDLVMERALYVATGMIKGQK